MGLVGTKLRPKFFVEPGLHVGRRTRPRFCERGDVFPGAKALRGQRLGQERRERFLDPDFSRFLFHIAVDQRFPHLAPRLGRHEQHPFVGGARVGLAGLEPALDFGLIERDRPAADGKFQVETEPIPARAGAERKFGFRDVDLAQRRFEPGTKADRPGLAPARQRVGQKSRHPVFLDEAECRRAASHLFESCGFDLGQRLPFGQDVAPPETVRLPRVGKVALVRARFRFSGQGKFFVAIAGDQFQRQSRERAVQPRLDRGPADFDQRRSGRGFVGR